MSPQNPPSAPRPEPGAGPGPASSPAPASGPAFAGASGAATVAPGSGVAAPGAAVEEAYGPLPTERKLLFSLVLAVFLLLLLEGLNRIGRLLDGKVTDNRYPSLDLYVPHPYLNKAPAAGLTLTAVHDERGERTISINAFGFRGREFQVPKSAGTYRIFCIGGSTTFGHAVSDDGTWPAVLEERLAKKHPERKFEVVNAGVPGYTSFENLIDWETRIAEMEPDAIVIYQGINELLYFANYSPQRTLAQLRPVNHRGAIDRWLMNHSALYQGTMHTAERVRRKGAEKAPLAECPPWGPRAWERNLDWLVGMAKSQGVRVLLVTQASRVHPEADTAEELDAAGISQKTMAKLYGLAPATFLKTFEGALEAMRRVGAKQGVPVVDMYREFPKDAALYTDAVHFTEAGERRFAEALLERMPAEFLGGR